MNPISSDIFGRLDWLTKRIKNLYGAIGLTNQNIAQAAIDNPPYFEVTWDSSIYFWTKLSFANSDMGSNFTSMINVGNTQRFYGGSNIILSNPACNWSSSYANYQFLVSINDMGGVITQVGPNIFENCFALQYLNLPKAQITGQQAIKSCNTLQYVNIPSTTYLPDECFNSATLSNLNINKCTSLGTNVFLNVSGNSITITLPAALATDPQIVGLSPANTVTLIVV